MSTTDKRSGAESRSGATIPDHVVEDIARCLLPKLQAFFESEDGQLAFAEWKAQQGHTPE